MFSLLIHIVVLLFRFTHCKCIFACIEIIFNSFSVRTFCLTKLSKSEKLDYSRIVFLFLYCFAAELKRSSFFSGETYVIPRTLCITILILIWCFKGYNDETTIVESSANIIFFPSIMTLTQTHAINV